MKRRQRSGPVTHKRCWHSNARAPRGKPWEKVEELLEGLKAKHGYKAMALPIFETLWTLQTDNGWKGNAITQFVWEHYCGRTKYMPYIRGGLDMADLLAAVDNQAFPNWLDAYASKYGSGRRKYGEVKGEIISETPYKGAPHKGKPRKVKIARPKVETQAERHKRIGAAYRADLAQHDAMSAERNEVGLAKHDEQDIWRLISRGEFPLGVPLFEAELKRRADSRASKKR